MWSHGFAEGFAVTPKDSRTHPISVLSVGGAQPSHRAPGSDLAANVVGRHVWRLPAALLLYFDQRRALFGQPLRRADAQRVAGHPGLGCPPRAPAPTLWSAASGVPGKARVVSLDGLYASPAKLAGDPANGLITRSPS